MPDGNLVYPPNDLIAMSVQMGTDMTPNGDLEQRLEVFASAAASCVEELDKLRDTVEKYALSIKGLDLSELYASANKKVGKETDNS